MANPFPIVSLVIRENGEFVKKDTQELFAGKNIVLFGLPGAFTPTCSEKMLPGYEALVTDMVALGVDEVWCTSVNDDFVMEEWFDQRGIRFVKYIADGNAHLAAMLNQLVIDLGVANWAKATANSPQEHENSNSPSETYE